MSAASRPGDPSDRSFASALLSLPSRQQAANAAPQPVNVTETVKLFEQQLPTTMNSYGTVPTEHNAAQQPIRTSTPISLASDAIEANERAEAESFGDECPGCQGFCPECGAGIGGCHHRRHTRRGTCRLAPRRVLQPVVEEQDRVEEPPPAPNVLGSEREVKVAQVEVERETFDSCIHPL